MHTLGHIYPRILNTSGQKYHSRCLVSGNLKKIKELIEDLEIKVLYEKNEYLTWPPFNEADLDIYPTLMEVNIKFSEGNFKKILFISGDDIVG